MKYERKFMLQASHFNDGEVYAAYARTFDKEVSAEEAKQVLIKQVLPFIHGHNFIVTVVATGCLGEAEWLVNDVEMEEVVRQWDNVNLSVHRDFTFSGLRATTESMARILHGKLVQAFNGVVFSVCIEETLQAKATYP